MYEKEAFDGTFGGKHPAKPPLPTRAELDEWDAKIDGPYWVTCRETKSRRLIAAARAHLDLREKLEALLSIVRPHGWSWEDCCKDIRLILNNSGK